MAETTTPFDLLVFDFSFDIIDIVPAVLMVGVAPQYHQISPGQEVVVTLRIVNTMTTPGRRFLFTPAVGPAITVYQPDGTEFLAETNMHHLNVGMFSHVIHTEPTAPLGPYAASFTAANGDHEMVTRKYHIFTTAL